MTRRLIRNKYSDVQIFNITISFISNDCQNDDKIERVASLLSDITISRESQTLQEVKSYPYKKGGGLKGGMGAKRSTP